VLADGRRIGTHLPLGHGMVRAAERAAAIGADTIQVFADNPTAWRRRQEPPRELGAWRERLDELDLGPVAVHASYLANLAGPDPSFWERSIDLVVSDLRGAPGFGARFVNVHIGSHRGLGVEAGIVRVAEAVTRSLAQVEDGGGAAILVLEDSAGSGDGVGTTVEQLAAILEAAAARGADVDRLGFCLDTAHLWGAGYDVGTAEGVDALVEAFDSSIGLDRLRMMHLNDSRAERGSRSDRHEHLGAGRIGVEGLRRLLTHPALAGVATYLETPGMDEGYDAVNLARARAIVAGEPLEPLPPEAFELRRDRARVAPAEEPPAEEPPAEEPPAEEPPAEGPAAEAEERSLGADEPRLEPRLEPRARAERPAGGASRGRGSNGAAPGPPG
jgi:deoxyribonuclease IV